MCVLVCVHVLQSNELIQYVISICIGLCIYNVCVHFCVCSRAETKGRPYLCQTFFKKEVILCAELIRTVSLCAKPEVFKFIITCKLYLHQTINICIIFSHLLTNQSGTSGDDF